MAQWYVKELSKLTQVSVQTLHHYDRIGLLKPSVRLPNGYRLYSEQDLLKLQQIIALKFFGFALSQIKNLLSKDIDIIDHLSMQSQFLEEKAKTLVEASDTLKNIIASCSHDKSIPWENVIKLIEVFRMTQQLESTWAGKVMTSDELKEYATFMQEEKSRNAEEKKIFEQGWNDLVRQVNANLRKDPTSESGIEIGKCCLDWVNSYYGKKYASLRTTLWEKGIKEGYLETETGLSYEAAEWLDKAMDAYVRNRYQDILNQLEKHPHQVVLKNWEDMLTEFFGDNQVAKKEFCQAIVGDDKLNQTAKTWIKKYKK